MEELTSQLLVYLKGVWKYRWIALTAAWIVAMAGWAIVYKLPDDYQASARIYVDTQNVLKPLMAGMTVSPDLQQQVSIMSRTLISRPNVERVVRMVDLDIKVNDVKDQEKLVKDLMDKIKLGAAGRDNLFTIHYNNQNPKLAKDVVQSLLTILSKGGLEIRNRTLRRQSVLLMIKFRVTKRNWLPGKITSRHSSKRILE